MFSISKQFHFSAAHRLMHLPAGHKCGRLHGHNYIVEVVFVSEELDDRGFAGNDFADFAPIKKYIDETLDHRSIFSVDDPMASAVLNLPGVDSSDVVVLDNNPTAEWIAASIYSTILALGFENVEAVRVSETPGTWAEARVEPI